jgi:hypothetical protein
MLIHDKPHTLFNPEFIKKMTAAWKFTSGNHI